MNKETRQGEINRLIWLLLACSLSALITDWWGWSFAVGFALLSLWQFIQIYKLQLWLSRGAKTTQTPESSGMWQDIIGTIQRLQDNSRKRKKRLASMLSQFNKSTEAIPDAAVILHQNGEIEWANSAARRVLGIRNPQDIGQRIGNLVRSPDLYRYLKKQNFSKSIVINSPVYDIMELAVRITEYGDGMRLLVAHDVTAENRLQAVRKDFVANVSHELKSPLTVILGYTESLRGLTSLSTKSRDAMTAIDQQAQRMSKIVDDLLTLSKLELDTPHKARTQTIDVRQLMDALIRDTHLIPQASDYLISFDMKTDQNISGDYQELHSAFSNLINNAIQHTPAGTRIDVSWQLEQGKLCLSVSDNGPGIPRQHLPRLTERFYRVDVSRSQRTGGTGLGLSIVKHAIENNGGQLEIHSQPYDKTVFKCWF